MVAASLLLGGCAVLPDGILGYATNPRPGPVALKATGPVGGTLSDPVKPLLPEGVVDKLIGDSLLPWLTPSERVSLALASESAAAAATGTAVAWNAADGTGAITADGKVVPAKDVYRSHRGYVCRDLQQHVHKADSEPRAQLVTLCREDLGGGIVIWMPGLPD